MKTARIRKKEEKKVETINEEYSIKSMVKIIIIISIIFCLFYLVTLFIVKPNEINMLAAWIEFLRDPESETVEKLAQVIPEIKEAKELLLLCGFDIEKKDWTRVILQTIFGGVSAGLAGGAFEATRPIQRATVTAADEPKPEPIGIFFITEIS